MRRKRRALLLEIVGSGTEIPDVSRIGTDSDTEPDAGAKEVKDAGGSRSTVSANPAPSCVRRGIGEANSVGRISIGWTGTTGGGLISGLGIEGGEGRGVGTLFCTERDLLKLKEKNLSEERTLLLWSRGAEEGVAATETWTSLSCCWLFPIGTGGESAGAPGQRWTARNC